MAQRSWPLQIKKQSISDQVGEVEVAKLFKPITSGLRELTVPKAPLRRIAKKKRTCSGLWNRY